MSNSKVKKNILITMTAHMGDFIWATSAFAILKKTYPDVKITVLAPASIKPLIVNNPVIDDAIYSPYSNNDSASRLKKLIWSLKVIPQVFLRRFEAAFIFESSRISILIAKVAQIPEIIGGDLFFAGYNIPDPVSKYYTKKIELPKDQDTMHVSLRFQTIIKSYFNIYNNALQVLPDSSANSENALKLIKNKQELNVALCIQGLKCSSNIWDIENFKKVIDSLEKKFKDISFYLVGVKDNYDYAQSIALKPNIINVCGKTSLLDLMELLKKMDLLISLDTGVIHMAAAVNANVVSLHGPSSPMMTRPMTHKAVSLYHETDCSRCTYKREIEKKSCQTYPEPKCLKLITPQEVIEAASGIIEKIIK